MPRFVLLYHDCPSEYVRPSHWDLMLEAGDHLETWALAHLPADWKSLREQTVVIDPSCPPLATGHTVSAEHLAGHRLAYLEFEGPMTRGRGNVRRIVSGTFACTSKSDDVWRVSLDADLFAGEITLRRASPDGAAWLLSCGRI
jgi:hypothetical protein